MAREAGLLQPLSCFRFVAAAAGRLRVMQVPAIWFATVGAVLALAACGAPSTTASTTSAPPSAASGSPATVSTDACPTQLTRAQTEGPYFKAGSPARASLI